MKRRVSRGKKVRPTFLVFCEGETEVEYINLLRRKFRLSSISIKSKIKGLDIDQRFVNSIKADMNMRSDLDDKVFLMYDLDKNGVLPNLQKIRNADIITSNPCFELWYLLHEQDQTGHITTDACIKKLKVLVPNYEKGKTNTQLRDLIEGKTIEAVQRATKLVEFENPSSLVHKLLEELDKAKSND